MAKVTVIDGTPPVPPPPKKYVLELEQDEAQALLDISGAVLGGGKNRMALDRVFSALVRADVGLTAFKNPWRDDVYPYLKGDGGC